MTRYMHTSKGFLWISKLKWGLVGSAFFSSFILVFSGDAPCRQVQGTVRQRMEYKCYPDMKAKFSLFCYCWLKPSYIKQDFFSMDKKNVVEFQKDIFGCFNALETQSVQMIITQYLLMAFQQQIWTILEVRFIQEIGF